MTAINIGAAALERELGPQEYLLWCSKPKPGLRLHGSDVFFILFGLLWCSFATMGMTAAFRRGDSFIYLLWGIPIALIGGYFMVGRLVYDAYSRSKTIYGVTNRRALILSGLWDRSVKSVFLPSLQEITLTEGHDGSGTITLGPAPPFAAWYQYVYWTGSDRPFVATFEGILEARRVYELICQSQSAAIRAMIYDRLEANATEEALNAAASAPPAPSPQSPPAAPPGLNR